MRKSLFTATALAPLCLGVAPDISRAATTVTASRNTPIATSTANNGQPDDVDIQSGGTVQVTSAGPAVTLDSNNALQNEGTIKITDVDNAVGVLIQGRHTGSFTNTGAITVDESYAASDTANGDSINEAPFAKGAGRYGVRVSGTDPFVGAITNGAGGAINVKGNDSYGLSVEAPLQGSLVNAGTISVTGDRSVGLRETAGVSGDIRVTGAIASLGQAASAVALSGDVGGRFSIYSTVSGTGYATTTRSTDTTALGKIQSTAADVQQTGPVVQVSGNVAGGIYVGAVPSGTTTGSTADVDGDGIADGSEGAGAITAYGSAPALLVGSSSRDISIGAVGSGDNAYGLIVRGNVIGTGVYDGVTASAIQLGGLGGAVNLAGGVRLVGGVSATAYDANATGLTLGAGASAPQIRVEGSLAATLSHSSLVATPTTAAATALLIDGGGSASSLVNTGRITAAATGDAASALAVVDRAGTLTSIENDNVISATVAAATSGATPTGRQIALDLRANTTGVTLLQRSVNLTTTTTDSSGTTATTTTTATTPAIVGDVLFGSGGATLNLLGGSITGLLDLGSGSSSVTIDNGAIYTGGLLHSGGALALNVVNGTLDNRSTATLQATSLNLGSSGTLVFDVDAAKGVATSYQVSGPATLADGAKLGLTLLSVPTGAQTFTLISSPLLSVGATDLSLLGNVPYLLVADIRTGATTVDLDIRRRTAAEAGLNPSEGAALSAVTAASAKDSSVSAALLGQYTRSDFVHVFDQFLPDYAGGVFAASSAANRAISRAVSNPSEIIGDPDQAGAWATEFQIAASHERGDAAPFRVGGFGAVGGVQTAPSVLGLFGVDGAFYTADINNPHTAGLAATYLTELQAGLYWRAQAGGLHFDGRVGFGYDWLSSRRQFLVVNSAGATIADKTALASWNGASTNGGLGVSYQADFGRLRLRPQVHVDYLQLSQRGYTESGGGDAIDLAVGSRTGREGSVTGSVVAGWRFGAETVWRPELEVGYRDTFTGDAGLTTARFLSGGDSFTLTPAALKGGGVLARLRLNAASAAYQFNIEAGGEVRSRYVEGDLKFGVKVAF